MAEPAGYAQARYANLPDETFCSLPYIQGRSMAVLHNIAKFTFQEKPPSRLRREYTCDALIIAGIEKKRENGTSKFGTFRSLKQVNNVSRDCEITFLSIFVSYS